MKKNIIISGHICLDLIPIIEDKYSSFNEIITPGGLTNIGELVISGGGPVFNVGSALSKIIDKKKFNLFLNARTGEDILASLIEEKLKKKQIKFKFSKNKKFSTSYTIALATPKIDRAYLHNSGANDFFSSQDLFFPEEDSPGIFHFGYPQLMKTVYQNEMELKKIFKLAKDKQYVTSLDLSLVSKDSDSAKKDWKIIMGNALPHVDMLFMGLEEADFILNKDNYFINKREYLKEGKNFDHYYDDNKINWLVEGMFTLGANLLVLKAGKRGSFLFSKNHKNPFSKYSWANLELVKKAITVKNIKNSVGAGDNFAAGFIYSYISGDSPKKCLDNATKIAVKSLVNHSAEL